MKNYDDIDFEGLKRLNNMRDFEIADSYSDIRGWKVFSGDKKEIGYVTDLIIDLDVMKVIYADIDLYEDFSGGEAQENILVPIINAFLDEKKKNVHIPAIETGSVLKMPVQFQGIPLKDYKANLENIPLTQEKIGHHKHSSDSDLSEVSYNNFSRIKDYSGTRVKTSSFDYRGWDVFSLDNKHVGKVNDIIFDTFEKSIRYVELKTGVGLLGQNKFLLIPIGLAYLSENDDNIIIELNKESIGRLPEFSGDIITRSYEQTLRESIKSEVVNYDDMREDFYRHHHFDENNFYKYRVRQEH
ncbi:MAG: PRC-barrel domain-containing protein [Bacteroidota bacterium]|nr:PRC-barrel domain-containing protein [Bacteroidota bacterium]